MKTRQHALTSIYHGISDIRNNNRKTFHDAVRSAAVSGCIEPTYDRLPFAVKNEFSFKTFSRLVSEVL